MASKDEYQTKSGPRWRVRWVQDGEPRAQVFRVERQADQWVALLDAAGGDEVRAQRALEHRLVSGPSVAEALGRHVDQLTDVGDYQRKKYRAAIRDHFAGDLGGMPVAAVQHGEVVEWVRVMQGKGLAAKTIANHHGLLSAGMDTARHLGWREGNPCERVRLPKDDRTAEIMRIIEPDVFEDLVDVLPEGYGRLSRFLLGSGLRFSEATALEPTDFRRRGVPSVRVDKAWKEDGAGRFFVGPPKTRKARRTVSLGAVTVAAVEPLLGSRGLVFTTSQGLHVRSSAFHKVWGRAWARLGVPVGSRPRPHDLRHTHASRMLEAGMDIYELSRRMGHESIKTTIDLYSHLLEGAHVRGVEAADRAGI